jgi:three-Cys-motif partner protein
VSAKLETIWPAKPHTIAKIAMLRAYLHVWFAILARAPFFRGKDLWYIDGFAGPGEYTNHDQGSPIAALAAARSAIAELGTTWGAGDIRCLFIEEDRDRFAHLAGKLAGLADERRIHRHTFHGTFVDGLSWLKAQAVNPFAAGDPVFAFIDPCGPEGLSFSAVRELLSRPGCEVLVNLDSDGAGRICMAGESANHRELLNDVFGGGDWEAELTGVHQLHEAARKVVALYKRKLRAIPDVNYAFSFEMRKQHDMFDYHLVFASQHPRGLEKMKEVMRQIDKSGEYCFSDEQSPQQSLFTFDDPSAAALDMAARFKGQKVPYVDVQRHALNDSPFTNPKQMLAVLEKQGKIAVDVGSEQRSKNTYPERLHPVMKIQF